jgi:protein TonB
LVGAASVVISGCVTQDDAKKLVEALQAAQPSRPDVAPVMLTRDPIRYPASMYGQRAQGNVTLRIFIDSVGRVHPESTQVVESSGAPAFDSAAVAGVRDLRFAPAKRKGTPVSVSVLFPVYFRHPQAPPVPGDSVLHSGSPASAPGGMTGDSTGR